MSSKFLYLIAVLGAVSAAPARSTEDPAGYLVSGADGTPVTLAYGACVRTSQWTPDSSYRECEPMPLQIATDALFGFDSAVLTLDAERALDALSQHLAHADYQKVEIVGRADRIGRPGYNQQLSEERAKAVRDYLVAQGIEGSKIAVSGVGSAANITGTLCEGMHGEALMSCLQPDRSAGVTVIATQKAAMR